MLILLGAIKTEAHIIRIEITSVESPAFEGRAFGRAGVYEKLRGKAYGEIDPGLPQNGIITDLQLAPRNARGMVEYSMDIYILRPVDLRLGNHKLFVELPNRGGKLFGGLNNSGGGNDPVTAAQAGEAFLMDQGYSIAWCGWDISATPGNNNLTITVPVAKYHDGSSITGSCYEYISVDNNETLSYKLSYTAAFTDKDKAVLAVHDRLGDPLQLVPPGNWEFKDEHTIRLLPAGTAFNQSAIYEFTYIAKDPLVAGLGLAATRDFVSFLRHSAKDDAGHPNPLAGDVQFTFSFAVSQPARYMNDFQTLGFNQDEQGLRVFDGIENWLGGGSGVGINYRFAQPGRTERNRQNHFYPEAIFPFAYPALKDSFTGKTAGRGIRPEATHTQAKVFEINSSNEYWVKAASLLHTDLRGQDLPDPENVRFFLLSGMQHGSGNGNSTGIGQQYQNPTRAEPVLRALFVALDKWVTNGAAPPKSNVPRQSEGTAVMAVSKPGSLTGIVPQAELGWPDIPGVTYTGLITTRYLLDFGEELDKGIMAHYPFSVKDRPVYPNFVSGVDKDGNEVAGIRLPPVAVPVATTTGWALRREGFGMNDGAESAGQNIPFKITKAERLASGDPRLSLEERYGTHEKYVEAVIKCVRDLVAQRILLEEDGQKYIREAGESRVLR
jgi:hypothetical protein